MAATAAESPVEIVTGDTKVVQRGAADGLFITTTGVGEIVAEHEVSAAAAAAGDVLLLSGTLGDHALAVLAARGDFNFTLDVRSDCAPLWRLVEAALAAGGPAVHFMRDPTRGGLATVLAELAEEAGLGIEVDEEALPVSAAVRSACELLGYDPLSLANEGKMVFAVAPETGRRGARRRCAGAPRAPAQRASARSSPSTPAASRCAPATARGASSTCRSGELLPRIC